MLDTPDQNSGVSIRKTLIQVHETTGKLDPRLANEPMLMVAGAHLLPWFWEVCSSRGMVGLGMGGGMMAPLTYTEILSWATLKKIDLSSWEVSAIKALDCAYLKHFNKKGS